MVVHLVSLVMVLTSGGGLLQFEPLLDVFFYFVDLLLTDFSVLVEELLVLDLLAVLKSEILEQRLNRRRLLPLLL